MTGEFLCIGSQQHVELATHQQVEYPDWIPYNYNYSLWNARDDYVERVNGVDKLLWSVELDGGKGGVLIQVNIGIRAAVN